MHPQGKRVLEKSLPIGSEKPEKISDSVSEWEKKPPLEIHSHGPNAYVDLELKFILPLWFRNPQSEKVA